MRHYGQATAAALQLLILYLGARLASHQYWLYALPAIAVIALLSWRAALKTLRLIRDTPTSKVASAAQGYIELIGRGEPFPNTPLVSHLRHQPCLWYRYKIEERNRYDSRNRWHTLDKGESHESFMLRDSTGACVVDAIGGEINTHRFECWTNDRLRYSEWTLLENDLIYLLGEFHTVSFAAEFNQRTELSLLLEEWKKSPAQLHQRFDLNNDGELDMDEWLLARKAAQREVAKKFRLAQQQNDVHVIRKPADGKLFLISNRTPEQLSRRFLYWSIGQLSVFFICLIAFTQVLLSH